MYIGSGTRKKWGVQARFNDYNCGRSLPIRIEKSLREGFKITHKGLLCWVPIPSAAGMVLLRMMIHVLEAVFTLVFWPLVSRTKDYYMPRICPWKIEGLEWDGCCTHVPLTEKVEGLQTSYTDEEINAMAAAHEEEVRLRTNENRRVKHAGALKNKEFYCKVCDRPFPSKGNLKKHVQGPIHRAKAAGVKKNKTQLRKANNLKLRKARILAEKKFYCEPCDFNTYEQGQLDRHLKGGAHRRTMESLVV